MASEVKYCNVCGGRIQNVPGRYVIAINGTCTECADTRRDMAAIRNFWFYRESIIKDLEQ